MGISVSGNFPELLTQDLYKWYFEAYESEDTVYDKIVEKVPLDAGDGMKGTEAIGVSKLRHVEDGEEIPLTETAEGYTWYTKIKTFKDQIAITDNMLSDLNAGKLNQDIMAFAKGWGEGVRITEEEAVARIFNKGTLTAGDRTGFDGSFTNNTDPYPTLIYDGKPFFAASGNNHLPYLDSSATGWYNLIVANTYSSSNLQAAWTLMTVTNAISERGEKIKITPDTIVANPSMRFTIDLDLESSVNVASSTMYMNINKGLVTPVYWRYLDDTNAWFLGVRGKGVRFYDRMPSKIEVYKDFATDTWYAKIKRRFGVGVVQWRYWSAYAQATS